MKSKIRILYEIDEFEWHPWFAWRPVKVYDKEPFLNTKNEKKYLYRWVWREMLERKVQGTIFHDFYWVYRFPEEAAQRKKILPLRSSRS